MMKARLGKDAIIKGAMQRVMNNERGKPGGITVLCMNDYHLACDALGFKADSETENDREKCACHHHADKDYSDDKTNGPEADAEAAKGKQIGDMIIDGKKPVVP